MYVNGQGTAPDFKEALKWFHLAADQGDAQAEYSIGDLYDQGQGVPHDDKEALKWYRMAAEKGFAPAQHNLGAMYHDGQGVAKDYQEAIKWYRRAADQGDGGAQQILAALYQESIEWVRSAAGQGVALAQDGLGVLYAQGLGVPEDIKEAAKWWQLAADQGDLDAQSNLGFLYESGNGAIKQDYVLAYLWYSLVNAVYSTNPNARDGLQAVTRKMTPASFLRRRNWCRTGSRSNSLLERSDRSFRRGGAFDHQQCERSGQHRPSAPPPAGGGPNFAETMNTR